MNIDRQFLIQKYEVEQLTQKAIGDLSGTCQQTIAKYMKRWDIKPRIYSYVGSKNPNWKGGRIIRIFKSGTQPMVYIHSPNHPRKNKEGYVTEHRLIAEKVLGRYLRQGEEVHHINRNETDNRNENLLICTHAYHSMLHRRMEKKKYGTTAAGLECRNRWKARGAKGFGR